MSFFPLTERAKGPLPAPAMTVVDQTCLESGGGGSSDSRSAGGVMSKGLGDGVVFEGLALPGVVHEETRIVDTENAAVEASVEVRQH